MCLPTCVLWVRIFYGWQLSLRLKVTTPITDYGFFCFMTSCQKHRLNFTFSVKSRWQIYGFLLHVSAFVCLKFYVLAPEIHTENQNWEQYWMCLLWRGWGIAGGTCLLLNPCHFTINWWSQFTFFVLDSFHFFCLSHQFVSCSPIPTNHLRAHPHKIGARLVLHDKILKTCLLFILKGRQILGV